MSRRSNGEGAVYQTQDGRWRATVDVGWEDGKRKRKYLSGRTKAEVVKKVRKALEQVDAGLPLSTDGQGPTVGEWLWHWHNTVQSKRLRENTFRVEEMYIRRHLEPRLGRIRLRKLEPEHVEAMEAAALKDGLSPASVVKLHRTLSRAIKIAAKRGVVTRNVCQLVDPPSVPVQEVESLTADDVRKLIAASATRRNGCRWPIALALGLRQGEALGMAWPNVDLDAGTVAVKQALNKPWWRHGCGEQTDKADPKSFPCGKRFGSHCPDRVGHGRYLDEPKSRAGRRVVSLPAPLVEQLRAHRAAQLEERLAAGDRWWQPTEPAPKGKSWDLVFRMPMGQPIQAVADAKEWKALLAECGIPATKLHNARHTAATMLLTLKTAPRVVMEILGHSQIALTMNTYSHVIPELQQESAAAMGAALWGDAEQQQPSTPPAEGTVVDLPAAKSPRRRQSS